MRKAVGPMIGLLIVIGLIAIVKTQESKEGITENKNEIINTYEDLLKPNNSLEFETQ